MIYSKVGKYVDSSLAKQPSPPLARIVSSPLWIFIVKPENICTPPVGAVSNRTEFGVKLITESTIILKRLATGGLNAAQTT